MACARCVVTDYCVRAWMSGDDDHPGACYPPSKFKRFVAILREGEPCVFGIPDGMDFMEPVFLDFLVTDRYCEAVDFANVLAVSAC